MLCWAQREGALDAVMQEHCLEEVNNDSTPYTYHPFAMESL